MSDRRGASPPHAPMPLGIHRGEREVVIRWPDGDVAIPARQLRLACRCAHCREEMSGAPLLDPTTVPDDVHAVTISLVGSYAMKVVWSDGHDTGLYSWDYLRTIRPAPAEE